ncbi:MAG: DUF885 domain-containing protein [Pseudomonadota bacterium]|nr:DUF885 domain-containing protein [Pseudomonadota bacterium]
MKPFLSRASAVGVLVFAVAACGRPPETPSGGGAATAAAKVSPEEESKRLYDWLEAAFEEQLSFSPMAQTSLGRKTNYDKWDQATDEAADRLSVWRKAKLAELRSSFDPARLDDAGKLNYRLYEYDLERDERDYQWRDSEYNISQFGGAHQNTPPFLINFHRVDTLDDAAAYIVRLETMDDYLDQNRETFEKRAAAGVIPPSWAFPQMIETARNVIAGAPFDDGEPSALYADIAGKIDALGADAGAKEKLKARAATALVNDVKPAYERMIASFEAVSKNATGDDGVWKLPNGAAFYDHQVAYATTTGLAADEIHEIGLRELDRIHGEMRKIMADVGYQGTLEEFLVFLRTDPQFFYPDTDDGRDAYLAEATRVIDEVKTHLDELFLTKPKADLIVKRVEPFREKAAGIAFYNRPAPDGSRPGIYYVNLANMAAMPKFQLQAIAYHEGAPGHHMQIAIAQELENTPSFRRFGGYGAYTEGWGLYAEELPKELGLYTDPYADFGRLGTEAWRAVRLVVDTGIHSKKWTREQAIDFMVKSVPVSEEQARKEIERYVVIPGQATAYMIGKLKIKELRARAKEALGDRFDLREFHDVVLANGSVPLDVLDDLVDEWIASKKAA